MVIRTIFNNLPAGNQPLSLFDQQFSDFANWSALPCTCVGTNSLALTPMANVPTLPGYGFLNLFSFVAPATSTGLIYAAVGSLAQLPVYLADGVTQAASGAIVANGPYVLFYSAALNSNAGGFYIQSMAIAPSAAIKPTFLPSFAVGLGITNGTPADTQVSVTATAALIATPSGQQNVLRSPVTVLANTGSSGAGGLDTGAIAPSTWYYVYLIDNGASPNALLSLSATNPVLPTGYIYAMRIGAVLTDSSSKLFRFIQSGNRAAWRVTPATNTAGLPVLATGPAGSVNAPTWVAVSLASAVPPTATHFRGTALLPGGLAYVLLAAPNNNYGPVGSTTNSAPLVLVQQASDSWIGIPFEFTLESGNIYWATGAGYLLAYGWTDAVPAV